MENFFEKHTVLCLLIHSETKIRSQGEWYFSCGEKSTVDLRQVNGSPP